MTVEATHWLILCIIAIITVIIAVISLILSIKFGKIKSQSVGTFVLDLDEDEKTAMVYGLDMTYLLNEHPKKIVLDALYFKNGKFDFENSPQK